MHRKLTITLDEEVYMGLHSVIGNGKISQFIENLVKPHVLHTDLMAAYKPWPPMKNVSMKPRNGLKGL
jgi:predicted CopG family antitoxin